MRFLRRLITLLFFLNIILFLFSFVFVKLSFALSHDDFAREQASRAELIKDSFLTKSRIPYAFGAEMNALIENENSKELFLKDHAREIELLKNRSEERLHSVRLKQDIEKLKIRSDERRNKEGPRPLEGARNISGSLPLFSFPLSPSSSELKKSQITDEGRADGKGKKEIKELNEEVEIDIFISFSMPKESLRAWIIQANKVEANVYIRGLVENSFLKTADRIRSILREDDKGGLSINPMVFSRGRNKCSSNGCY